MFDKVVTLTVNQCVQCSSTEQVHFRDLLLILCESTFEDWKLLICQPSNVANLSDFEDATQLFYSNNQVPNYNHKQLAKLVHPIANNNGCHSSEVAKKVSADDMAGLEPVVFLAKGARVMLTMNLWSCVGLCNGETGTVVNINFQNNHQPPDLPIAVIMSAGIAVWLTRGKGNLQPQPDIMAFNVLKSAYHIYVFNFFLVKLWLCIIFFTCIAGLSCNGLH